MDNKVSTKLTDVDRLILMAQEDLKRDIITLESWIGQLECVAAPAPCVLCEHTQACPKNWAPSTVEAQKKAVNASMRSVIGQTRRLTPLVLSNGQTFEARMQRSRHSICALLWDGWSILRKLRKRM
jgi:hypothetical protein